MLFLGPSEQAMKNKLERIKIDMRKVHMDTAKLINLTPSIAGWVAGKRHCLLLALFTTLSLSNSACSLRSRGPGPEVLGTKSLHHFDQSVLLAEGQGRI